MPRIKLTTPQRLSDERREEINRAETEEKPQGILSVLATQLAKLNEETPPAKKSKDKNDSKSTVEDEKLQEDLSYCKFFVTLNKNLKLGDGDTSYCLGKLEFKVVEDGNDAVPECDECWLYLSRIPGRSMLYYEWNDNDALGSSESKKPSVKYYLVEGPMDYSLYTGIRHSKDIMLVIDSIKPERENGLIYFTLGVFLRLNKTENLENKHERPVNKNIQKIAAHFLNIRPPQDASSHKSQIRGLQKDIEELYAAVKLSHVDALKVKVEETVFHDSLLPILRPYQTAAVNWMLERERCIEYQGVDECEMDPLYVKVSTMDSKDLYYNPFNGSFDWEFPKKRQLPTGGILADEMGLGKTVEVLACILSNPRKDLPPVERLEQFQMEIEDEDDAECLSGNSYAEKNEVSEVLDGSTDDEIQVVGEKKRESLEVEETDVIVIDNFGCQENVVDAVPEDSNGVSENSVSENTILKESKHVPDIKSEILNNEAKESSDVKILEVKDEDEHNTNVVEMTESDKTVEVDLSFEKECKMPKTQRISRRSIKTKNHKRKKKKTEVPSDPVMETIDAVLKMYCGTTSKRKKSAAPKKLSENQKATRELYESMIAEYNVAKILSDKTRALKNRGFFLTKVAKKSLFECTCGMSEVEAGGIGNNAHLSFELQQVQCNACDMWQHARCVGYDLNDPFRGKYYCPHCWQEKDLVPSGATLIVSPRSIAFQWMNEIEHHIRKKDLKVMYYRREQENGFIQPMVLARHDIVIVSYEALTKELDYVDIPHCNSDEGRRLRFAKRFMAIPSPLTRVQWWRICLDEAQMVEVTSTKTAEMALRLSAVHRWCITGTPIQRSLNDLYGLVLFFDYFPYCVLQYWNGLLYYPYLLGDRKPFYEALCKVMWRSCKKDVLDQIRIPSQHEKVYWLKFCPTEMHFYRKQHVHCSRSALAALSPFPDDLKLDYLDRKSLSKILTPFLSLRQACCHPQAVKMSKMAQLGVPKTSEWSMEHLLSSLVQKAKVEAEEALRICVAALNGLAGVHILLGEWSLAEEKYRSILKLSDEYKDHLKVDTLQKIHTLHNLAEILDNGVSAGSLHLREEALELQTKYLNKCSKKVTCALGEVTPLSKSVEGILQSDTFQCDKVWWVEVLEWSTRANLDAELVRKVKNDITDYMSTAGKVRVSSRFNHISDVSGLRYLLRLRTDEMYEKRETILSEMHELVRLETDPLEASRLVMIAVDCHLRLSSTSTAVVSMGAKRKSQSSELGPGASKEVKKRKSLSKTKKSSKCDLCDADGNLEEYEALLFKVLKKKVEGEAVLLGEGKHIAQEQEDTDAQAVKVFGQLSRGNWADGEIERMLKVILGFAKSKKLDRDIIEDGNNQIKLMEHMKKEYKYLRILWRQLNDQISAIDELNMAKLRLGLKVNKEDMDLKQKKKNLNGLSNNPETKVESIHLLGQHELEPYSARLSVELAGGSCDLRKRMGQLFYLQNLEKANSGRHGGVNPDPCPICHKVLGEKWSVLHCGHCYCMECIKVVITEYCPRGGSIKCAVCREVTHHAEVSYVDTSGGPPGESCVENKDGKTTDEENVESSKKLVKKLFEVKGSHSTKVEAVVRTILSLVDQDPEVKALIFSSFTNILDIIGKALFQNDIKFAQLKATGQFQKNLDLFKDKDRDVTVLLLPVNSGSKGLNLIEATHVLLVEPILNGANELQAIGRVHRIGQTRRTVVHRFLVRDTIEERMHCVFHGGHHRSAENDSYTPPEVTIGDLRLIFESEESSRENSSALSVKPSSSSEVSNNEVECID